MKRYALAIALFLTGCGSTTTSVIIADRPTPNQRFGTPELRVEFKINPEPGGRHATQTRLVSDPDRYRD